MTLQNIGILVAILGTLSTIVGVVVIFLVRYALIPLLEKRWTKPIEEALGHIREMKAEITVMSRAFDGHLDWSQREVDQIWKELNRRRRA